MSKLLRHHSEGRPFFLTAVTANRQPLLIDNFDLLWGAIQSTQERRLFALIAWVVLPDHFHAIVDPSGRNISKIVTSIKIRFAHCYRHRNSLYRHNVWQKRFWDHVIRDEEDMNRHLHYIHYNPVKHGLAGGPAAWKFSSFGRFVRDGQYEPDWGTKRGTAIQGDYGE